MSLVAAPRLPQAAALPSPPTAAVFVVMLGAMCFHMALCFVNTKVGGVGNGAIIGCEIVIVSTVLVLSYPVIDYQRFLIVSTALLYLVGLAAIRTAFHGEGVQIKPVRDLLIPIAFFFFGMRAPDVRRADRLVAVAAAIVVAILPLSVGLDAMRQLIFPNSGIPGVLTVSTEMVILAVMGVVFLVGARLALAYLERLARREGRLTLRWQ